MAQAAELFGGVRPRDTRERILFAALDLFYQHGFHEVGLDRILAEVGVTKTTFYNHFESRDHLILEALGVRDAWEAAAMDRRLRELAGYDPRALLLATFDVLDEWFNHPEYRGCMFVVASAEFPLPTSPIHRRAARSFEEAEARIRGMAEAAGARDPAAVARVWGLLTQGALARRLVSGDSGAARAAGTVFAAFLAGEVGAAGGPGRGGAPGAAPKTG